MNPLARQIMAQSTDRPTRLVYGVMASATTVYIDGATTAVTVPKLDSVGTLATGNYVSMLVSGADAVIVGTLSAQQGSRPWIQTGDDLSSVAGSVHTITYPTAFPGVPRLLNLAVRASAGGDRTTTLRTITATAITFEVYIGGAINSSAAQINWSVAYFG